MKNMVVLKNLPSNIVEEAFVVLKANKKIKNLERVDGSKKNLSKDSSKKESDYMLKEAEMIVSNYISKIESNDKNSVFKKKKVMRSVYSPKRKRDAANNYKIKIVLYDENNRYTYATKL